MPPARGPSRSFVTMALAFGVLTGCTSPTGSPSATPSPTSLPTPTPTPTAAPTPIPTATANPSATGPDHLEVAQIAAGLSSPIGITNAGDGSDRLFVVQRGGQVLVVDADGNLSAAPFLDLGGRVLSGGEQGLLGLAFHPAFASNGRLFVDYTRSPDGATVISELTAAADHGSASAVSEKILLVVDQPFANHNGGQIAFGPDGYLYIGLGDGGSGGDPLNNGQNRQALLGKILRIDVNGTPADGKAYVIPNDNPYAPGGVSPGAGLPEIWAYGLRNPWRFSFDRANGDLYIGDVGQGEWEEVDRQPASSRGGENYGWNAYEGTHCFVGCDGVSAVPPITEYSHGVGCSITGGYVYRGAAQPTLGGFYILGDYCSGIIYTLPAGGGSTTLKAVADTSLSISSFGEGEDGEVYVADVTGGGVYRVVVGS